MRDRQAKRLTLGGLLHLKLVIVLAVCAILSHRERVEAVVAAARAEAELERVVASLAGLERDIAGARTRYETTAASLRPTDEMLQALRAQGVDVYGHWSGVWPPIEGAVQDVRPVDGDPGHPLVLLDVGSAARVVRGHQFFVFDARDLFVAKLVVERVLPTKAGCRVLYWAKGVTEVRAGDRVICAP